MTNQQQQDAAQDVYQRKVSVAKTRRDTAITAAKNEYQRAVRQASDELHASSGAGPANA